MAPHVYVEDLKQHVGQEVTIKGWLYNMAGKGKLYFLQVRDGSGIVQAVVSKADVPEDVFAKIATLKQETSIIVTGEVREDKRAAVGGGIGVELGVKHLEVVALPTADFPISPKEHGTAFLMSQRHLWLRSRKQVAVLRVRHEIIRQIRNYFDSHGFVLMDAPIFTPNACEGT
ncbi:MAG: OB-fold nucleic acid binding domain-containing protein, partial [Polyangia bacterium]